MQESQVTVDGVEHPLSDLFTVVATQNPVEYEGTYPLPEAQLDRFLMKIVVDYPEPAEELAILTAMNALGQRAQAPHQTVQAAASDQDIRDVRSLVREVVADESVLAYITKIVQQTRGLPSLSLGASTRSAVMLLQAAKALALLRGSGHVRPDEVQGVAHATLRHRLTLTPEARIEGLTADDCVADLLKQVPVPR
jgi:MoxR-like ATPase